MNNPELVTFNPELYRFNPELSRFTPKSVRFNLELSRLNRSYPSLILSYQGFILSYPGFILSYPFLFWAVFNSELSRFYPDPSRFNITIKIPFSTRNKTKIFHNKQKIKKFTHFIFNFL